MTADGVRELLKIKMEHAGFKSIKQAAWRLEMAEEHLRKQINGTMPPGRNILKWLGLRREFVYEYISLPELLELSNTKAALEEANRGK